MQTLKTYLTLILSGTALALVGCSSNETSTCGDGSLFTHKATNYCLYEVPITEQGFECPASYPNEFAYNDFRACAMGDMVPDDFEPNARMAVFMGSDAGTKDGNISSDAGDCYAPWQSPVTEVTPTSMPTSVGMTVEFSYNSAGAGDRALITLETFVETTFFSDSDGPFTIEENSGHWVELRDANDKTLYTQTKFSIISDFMEAFPGPDGGFVNIPGCLKIGTLRITNMANPPEATQIVFFQDAIDGMDGPTIEFARFDLPGR